MAKRKTMRHKKLHTLLAMALTDLRKAEKSKVCVVDMHTWHTAKLGQCRVCLAGAVMHFGLGARRTMDKFDYDKGTENRLAALDWLRVGCVARAAWCIYSEAFAKTVLHMDRKIVPYKEDRQAWWRDMEKLLADLQEANL